MTHMVDGAEVHGTRGLSSTALVAQWPTPLDIEVDTFLPGKVENFDRELTAALRSRGCLDALLRRAPTLQELTTAYPDEDPYDIVECLDSILCDRKRIFAVLADHLPRCLKLSSLGIIESSEINRLSVQGLGLELYVKIKGLIDIRSGRSQDKLQIKFGATKLTSGD